MNAFERMYHEVRQPQPPPPARPPALPVLPPTLARSDVDAILNRKRSAAPEELQYAIDHAKELRLTSYERDQLGVAMTVALVNRTRPGTYKPSSQFLYDVLDVADTPVGLLHNKSWVQRELKAGGQAIASCRFHRPPRCHCWRSARETLWQIQNEYGERSPEGYACVKLWEQLEELEQAARPERGPGLIMSAR